MVSFFSIMIDISTVIAMVVSVVFFAGILFRCQTASDAETFKTCNNQMRVCKISSVIFAILYWFVVSGLPQEECLKAYEELSATCFRWGRIWIIFAFVSVVISIILGISKRGKDELEIMRELKKSSFVMGTFFLIIAFILKVK